MGLQLRIEHQGNALPRFSLSGSIDENSKIQEVLSKITTDGVLDLSKVDRINSVGLLQWLKTIGQLTQDHRITVEGISYGMAIQANQLIAMFGKAKVHSCLAPYYCPSCKSNREVVVTATEVLSSAQNAPPKKCPDCQAEMDFDEMDEYFLFLRDRR